MENKPFCHLKVTNTNFQELMETIDFHVKERKRLTITRLTLRLFVKSLFNKELRKALNNVDVVLPIGRLLYKLVRKIYPEYGFSLSDSKELMTPLIREYHQFLINFVLLGGTLQGLNKLTVNLRASFSNVKIIGAYPEIYWERKNEDIQTVIKKSEPHIFFLGIGQGKDEVWMEENKELLPKTVVLCVHNQIKIMCHDMADIPYKYKIAHKEFIYTLKTKPYRIFDVFVWGLVWIKWRWFKHKLKKEEKNRGTL